MGRQPFMPRKPIDALDRRARVLPFYAKGNHVFGSPSVHRPRQRTGIPGRAHDARGIDDSGSPPRTKRVPLDCALHRRGRLASAELRALPATAWARLYGIRPLRRMQSWMVDAPTPNSPCQTRDGAVPSPKLATRVTPGQSERDLGEIQMPRPSASIERMGTRLPRFGRPRASALKAASDHMERHPQELARSRSVPCERRNSMAS